MKRRTFGNGTAATNKGTTPRPRGYINMADLYLGVPRPLPKPPTLRTPEEVAEFLEKRSRQ